MEAPMTAERADVVDLQDVKYVAQLMREALETLDLPPKGSWGYKKKRVVAATYLTHCVMQYFRGLR
jgi:hypothetical protein